MVAGVWAGVGVVGVVRVVMISIFRYQNTLRPASLESLYKDSTM